MRRQTMPFGWDTVVNSPIVETASGKLEGTFESGVCVFKGIPYCASTAGFNRFRPPMPVAPWRDVRSAKKFGPVAPQNAIPQNGNGGRTQEWLALSFPSSAGDPVGGQEMSEDCLVLNVWTPSVSDGQRRPVMVWYHGGGYLSCSGADEYSYGENLARDGDVVVVTVNHRLGILGYLQLAEILGDEFVDSGAAGMLDAVAALRWVQENISAFGGDPSNVTVFGQSGGAGKVACLLSMPAAKDLFHRAIIQSGPLMRSHERDCAAELTEKVLIEVGLTPKTAHLLQTMELERLLAAQAKAMQVIHPGLPLGFAPVVGSRALPVHPLDASLQSESAQVPVMIGMALDELSQQFLGDPLYGSLSHADVRQRISDFVGDNTDEVLTGYQAYWPDLSPSRLFARIYSEQLRKAAIHLASRRVSDGLGPVFMYQFTYETEMLDGLLGSCHNLDLPFVFRNVDRIPLAGQRPERHKVQDNVSSLWTSFARDGVPSSPERSEYPAYTLESRATILIDEKLRVEQNPWGDFLEMMPFHPLSGMNAQ